MLRKGYVFLLVVFLCKILTGVSCNSSANVPAGESKQIFPLVQIFFSFSFPSFRILFPYGGCSAEEQRTPSLPVCLPPVSDTPHCRSMQGLPTSLGTTGSVGPPLLYLLQETTWACVCCPLAAGHRVLEGERRLDPVSGAGSTAEAWQFAPMESERLH